MNWQDIVHNTQDKLGKNPTQYLLDTTKRNHMQIPQIRHVPSYKQLDAKTKLTSFLCENQNRHGTQKIKTHNRTKE